MQWSERKFENRVLEKVAIEIALKKVELSTLITDLEKLVNNANTVFSKICNVLDFTK